MTGPIRPVLPLAGPLEEDPTNAVEFLATEPSRILDGVHDRALAMARTMLASAVVDLERGAWDERILTWLSDKDVSVIATVASLLRRCWQAGADAGRQEVAAELADAQALAQAYRTKVAALERDLTTTRDRADRLAGDVEAAATRIEARFDAGQVSAQGAFERLLGEVRDAVGGAR